MNTWSKCAIFAGAAFAVVGLASQAFAPTSQTLHIEATSCTQLFPNTPGIKELVLAKGGLVGVHVEGVLTVNITATSLIETAPSEFDWESTNGSPTRVNAVIVTKNEAHVYPYPTGAFFDTGLTAPLDKTELETIDEVRFCFGGPVSENAAFNQCPFTQTCTPGGGGEDQVNLYINPDTGGFSDCSCVESQVCQFGSALSPCTEPGDFPLLVGWETIVTGEEEDLSHFFLYCPASTAADAECKKYFFPHFP